MENLKLYRKRFIPEETVLLSEDRILFKSSHCIVTQWNVLKPRKDFARGYSCYYLNEGYKISKFINSEGNLVYYYCDIIDTEYFECDNSYVFTDLLADVIVYENGNTRVVDLGEIAEALDKNLISIELAKKSLKILDKLLNIIYSDGIESLLRDEMEKPQGE